MALPEPAVIAFVRELLALPPLSPEFSTRCDLLGSVAEREAAALVQILAAPAPSAQLAVSPDRLDRLTAVLDRMTATLTSPAANPDERRPRWMLWPLARGRAPAATLAGAGSNLTKLAKLLVEIRDGLAWQDVELTRREVVLAQVAGELAQATPRLDAIIAGLTQATRELAFSDPVRCQAIETCALAPLARRQLDLAELLATAHHQAAAINVMKASFVILSETVGRAISAAELAVLAARRLELARLEKQTVTAELAALHYVICGMPVAPRFDDRWIEQPPGGGAAPDVLGLQRHLAAVRSALEQLGKPQSGSAAQPKRF